MTTPRVYRTEAIVLRHARLGEADRVLTLFTPGYGKVRAVAKGVLRPTSHLAGHLEVFSRSTLLLARARSLDIVTQAVGLESFLSLREELWRMSAGLYGAELLDRLSEDRWESSAAYQLLLSFLRWLANARDGDLPLRFFEMQLLEVSGYRPELYTCLHCKRDLNPEVNGFSGASGGVLCAACSGPDPETRPVSVAALKVMRLLQRGDLSQVQRLRLQEPVARELEQLMRHYVPYVLERELRSASFVDAVRSIERLKPYAPHL